MTDEKCQKYVSSDSDFCRKGYKKKTVNTGNAVESLNTSYLKLNYRRSVSACDLALLEDLFFHI